MASELKPCPFCAKPLTVRNGVNPYGSCDTEGCWMAEAKIGISCEDPKQVKRWNTRPAPAATDTGLVTVSPKDYDFYEDGELVTRSQAVELLAAERAEKDMLKADFNDCNAERQRWKDRAEKAEANLEFIERVKGVNEKYANALAFLEMTENDDPEEFAECFWNKFIALEADNATQDARIKEAEAGRDRVRRIFKRNTRLRFEAENRSEILAAEVTALREALIGEQSDRRILEAKLAAANGKIEALVQSLAYETAHEATKRAEAAEAELAAAQKALEPFALEAANWCDTVPDSHRSLCTEPGSKTAHPGSETTFTVGDLRKARAVLGGKPS